jgi:hypothetical protein
MTSSGNLDVAGFLAFHDGGTIGRWERIATRVTALLAGR